MKFRRNKSAFEIRDIGGGRVQLYKDGVAVGEPKESRTALGEELEREIAKVKEELRAHINEHKR